MRKLFKQWLFDNPITIKKKVKGKEIEVNGINIYGIEGIPKMLFFSVNRFTSIDRRLHTLVEIQKRINPFESSDDKTLQECRWSFHSAICHHGRSLYSGHYYSLLSLDDGFYLFNDLMEPSLQPVKLGSNSITRSIKQEVVFLIYALEDK